MYKIPRSVDAPNALGKIFIPAGHSDDLPSEVSPAAFHPSVVP
jgi:hypothetical protein